MRLNKILATIILLIIVINIIMPTMVFAEQKDTLKQIYIQDEIGLGDTTVGTNKKDENTNTEEEESIKAVDENVKENENETVFNEEEDDEIVEERNSSNNEKLDFKIYSETQAQIKEENNETFDQNEDGYEEEIKSKDFEKESKVKYNSHIEKYGWEDDFSNTDGETSGTVGKGLRIEAIKIALGNSEEILENANIKYKVHVQDYGWMDWKQNGEVAGTVAESKRIEAIRIELENLDGYSVIYRTHVQDIGWTDWVKNGQVSGTEGKSLRIEAIQIKIVNNTNFEINYEYNENKNTVKAIITSNKEIKNIDDENWILSSDGYSCYKEYDVNDSYNINIKDSDGITNKLTVKITQIVEPISNVKYNSHIQDIGWEKTFSKIDGDISGNPGENKRLEAIRISLGTSDEIKEISNINYKVYVDQYGWQNWKADGEIAGTTGEGRGIKAIQIEINNINDYVVQYKVYIKGIGWQKWKCNGEIAGNREIDIEAIQIQIVKKENKIIEPEVKYKTHVQDIGWQNEFLEDKVAGTTGKSKGIEAIEINLGGVNEDTNIKYRVHVSNYGWQNWKNKGEKAGTTGQAKSIEAIEMYLENLEDYTIEYRVHISNYGWQKWRKEGERAGTTGQSRKIEAIQIRIIYKGSEVLEPEVVYNSHIQGIGWQENAMEGFSSGTEGKSLRIEALKIDLIDANPDANIIYNTHVQDIGWQGWKKNGEVAGTTGQSKRIEAIRIKLEGLDNYTVEYKVHIQDIGWSDWMIDGEIAGTTGQNKRIEAIQIRIVAKYYKQYTGIDVSEHNGEIDWGAVKKFGIQFAMIRCGYRGYGTGRIVEDSKFRNNINGALSNGIQVGLYFFSQAINEGEAVEEANFVLNLARQYKVTYPIVIDSEMSGASNNSGRADGLNSVLRTNVIVAFCNQIKNNGYIPMIYSSKNWLYNNLEISRLLNYETWLAHYTGSISNKSNYKYDYTMWQYTSEGSVNGINTRVDMNIGYKNYM